MKTFRSEGERIQWTNDTGETVPSGGVVAIGAMIAIAVNEIAVDALGLLEVRQGRIHELPAKAADEWDQGAVLYWDEDNGYLTDTEGDNVAGHAAAAKAALAETAEVLLNRGLITTVDNGAITAAKLAADAVTTAKILDANVTAAKLAANAVETAKILDANVTAAKLAADAVTTAKILDANVTAGKLAANAVETAKILDANVTGAKLAAAVQDRIVTGTVTAGAEVAHARTITVQLKDSEGNNLAEQRLIRLCVNATASLATPAATGTDTFGAPSAGAIYQTVTAKAEYEVMTDAAGKYVFALTHNDAGSNRFIDVFADSKPISSGAIAFDAV